MSDSADFCASQVHASGRDRYLATLFAPQRLRPALHALYAFDIEIARIPALVREPMAGEIRLQWWHEALHGLRPDEAQAHPVARALLAALARHPRVNRSALLALLDARIADLYVDPFESLAALARYSDATMGTVVQAAAQILLPDEEPAPAIGELARLAGFVLTVGDIMRHFARDASRGKVFVPRDVAARSGLNLDDVAPGRAGAELGRALQALCDEARGRLAEMLRRARRAPAACGPALLPAAAVPLYLRRVERAGFDPFHEAVDVPQWRRQWAMWRAARVFR